MTSELERQLIEFDLGLAFIPENSLTHKVKNELENRVKGVITQAELEEFLINKLDLTVQNLDKLESEEYPESAAEIHAALHTDFVYYEQGLLILEDFLARETERSEFSLSELFEVFRRGDKCIELFKGELENRLAPMTGINTLW